ncbi:MAG: hypothetical protein LBG88_03050 [Christensenellaceae bacterium]|jgi:uncharacterized HAD superfamily protein|nr:hypothetical protein [Christensenellaceae bacterium]
MRIGIDFDGVLFETEKWWRAAATLYNNDIVKNKVADKDAFLLQDKFNWSRENVLGFFKKYHLALTAKASPLPFVKEMTDRLRKEGHKLFIISTRQAMDKQMIVAAEKALQKYKIIVDGWLDGVTDFSGRVPKMDKIQTLQKNKIDIMIEDNPEIAEECARAKIPCILIPARHTRSVKSLLVYEVEDWVEIYQTITEVSHG